MFLMIRQIKTLLESFEIRTLFTSVAQTRYSWLAHAMLPLCRKRETETSKRLREKPLAKIDEVDPPEPPMLFSESSIQSMPANIEERQYRKKNIRKGNKHV